MHEQSLVANLLTMADDICRQHGAIRITEIQVEVGPLSGVEPLLLLSAFEQLAPATAAAGAALVVEEVALTARCASCAAMFEVHNWLFRCPTCGGAVKVIRGDRLELVSVSLQDPAAAQEMVSR